MRMMSGRNRMRRERVRLGTIIRLAAIDESIFLCRFFYLIPGWPGARNSFRNQRFSRSSVFGFLQTKPHLIRQKNRRCHERWERRIALYSIHCIVLPRPVRCLPKLKRLSFVCTSQNVCHVLCLPKLKLVIVQVTLLGQS